MIDAGRGQVHGIIFQRVIAGLDPAIHAALLGNRPDVGMDARVKRAHDEWLGAASLPGFERALRPAAGFLHNLVRIDGACQFGDAFDDGAGRSLGRGAGHGRGGAQFVGLPAMQVALADAERQVAGARRDVDVADSKA